MKRLTIATLIVLGIPTVAAAQPEEKKEPPKEEKKPAEEVKKPAQEVEPEEPPEEPRVIVARPPGTVPATPVYVQRRPSSTSVGLGIGWNFPTDLQVPNAFSARFRLASGLTMEPELALERGDFSREDGLPPPENVTSTRLNLGVAVRKPLKERGRADLDLIGSIRIAQESLDPEGEDNTDSTVEFSINYGLAVGIWITPNVQVSVTALNPMVVAGKDTDEQGIGIDPIETTFTTFGAVWDPDFIAMVHLYL